MTIEVETPDGTIVEFPDDTPDDVIKRVMSQQSGGAIPVTTAQAGPPIPEPVGLEEAGALPPKTAQERREELKVGARPAIVAGAATVGAAAGTPAGPLGLVAGAAGGAAAGSLVFDNINDALRAFGIEELPGGTLPGEATALEGAGARVGTALEEARTETMFTGGFSLIFPVKRFLGPALGRVFGVRGEAAKEMAKLAALQGIELAAVDIGGPIAKGFARVLGIFPFTGTPLRDTTVRRDRVGGILPFTGTKEQIGQVAKEAQLTKRVDDILNEVAPTSTLAGEAGVDLLEAARGADRRFRSVSAELYDAFRGAAREIKDESGSPIPVVPTDETIGAISRFVEEARLGEVPIQGDDIQVLKGGIPEPFEAFLKDAQKLPSHLTYDQHVRLQKQFEGFIDKLSPDPFTVKRVAQIKQAMEADLNNIGAGVDVSRETLEEIRQLKSDADTFFANGIVVFRTPTAQKFGRVDKRIFRAGPETAGVLNPDELLAPAFNIKSPQALKDLRSLVGDEAFQRAARRHLDEVVEASFRGERRGGAQAEVFDLDTFQANLGLVRGKKDRSAALEEILKGTGVKVQDLRDLVENARIEKISDPSTFVARRVTLGGAGALTAVLGVGAAATQDPSLLTPIALTLLARHSAKILADPKRLKWLTNSFSPDLQDVERRAFLLRLARSLGELSGSRDETRKPQQDRARQ